MFCMKCERDTDTPLERFDGEYFCRECKRSLFPHGQFCLTASNEQLFADSERLFYEGYVLGKDGQALVDAIDKCRQSAYELNPFATLAMGYYYENKYITEYSEYTRVKNAFKWYELIALYSDVFRSIFGGTAPTLEKNRVKPNDQLLQTATLNIYLLLCGADQNIASEVIKSEAHVKGLGAEEVLQAFEDALGLNASARPSISNIDDVNVYVSKFDRGTQLCGLQEVSASWLARFAELWGDKQKARLNDLFEKSFSLWGAEHGSYGQLKPIRSVTAVKSLLDTGAQLFLLCFCKKTINGFVGQCDVAFSAACATLRENGLMHDFCEDDITIARGYQLKGSKRFGDFIKYLLESRKIKK